MTPTREAVFTALFGKLSGLTWNDGTSHHFNTVTREVKLFSDVPPEQQPWICQAEHNEHVAQKSGLPYRWTWKASWMVYHRGPSPRTIWNNLILDSLADAMKPPLQDEGFFDSRNTLFGLVHHCYIEGEVFKDPGDIDEQALLIVPITILVP